MLTLKLYEVHRIDIYICIPQVNSTYSGRCGVLHPVLYDEQWSVVYGSIPSSYIGM